MYTKIDVVVQGEFYDFTDHVVDYYLKLPFVNNVIISCWETDKCPKQRRRVKIVRSKYPNSPGTDNKNLQIVSSLNGLKECEADFSVKVRSDQKVTHESMSKMFEFFINHNQKTSPYQFDNTKPKSKIFVAGMYPSLLFAIRDHLFWGHTDDLIDLFDIPLETNSLIDKVRVPKSRLSNYYNYFTRTESYLGAHYCANFDEQINHFILAPEKYLYDGCSNWEHTKLVSDSVIKTAFKSFPKNSLNLEWVRWRETGFSFNFESYLDACQWHEDGY